MTEPRDRLFSEVDRQMDELRQQANSIAARVGLLVSASAVGAGLLAANLKEVHGGEIVSFVTLGLATVAAIVALVPGLAPGPRTSKLTSWYATQAINDVDELFDVKIITLEANIRRVAVMSWAFYLQVVTVLAAVTMAFVAAARR